eukprot:UN20390
MLRLLPNRGLEAYHKNYAQRRRLRQISLPNEDF